MADLVSELAAQGRSLPPDDRVRLLDLLLESRQETSAVDDAWTQEIERRVASHDRGEGRLYELDEVMAEAARIAP
ncbi:addiction module protein [Paucibacter sp. XJ19-41]|uniref:addiction module protein n=1 Tax=Paucibacter sp. XJ19-41 TaxID=2927824 RepID=UPI00234946AD|nr:addiction module protein [Paucibacter sp. XJ19-41]MDC6167731.1 addiction module protein [Paucibacter sp. XJ19-41]